MARVTVAEAVWLQILRLLNCRGSLRRALPIGCARSSPSISWSRARRKAGRLPALSWIFQTVANVGAQVSVIRGWMLPADGAVRDLTAHQDRARLGSGHAHPVRFKAQLMGRLVLATDGLFKYIRAADIRTCAARGVDALIDSVRLKSGAALQDDVAVILLQ
jgi:hypothetical protein